MICATGLAEIRIFRYDSNAMDQQKPFRIPRSALLMAIAVLVAVGIFWYSETIHEPAKPVELVLTVDRGMDEATRAQFESRIQAELDAMAADPAAAEDISQILSLGILYYTVGDLGAAKAEFEKILARFPNDAPAHENLGQTLLEMGDGAGAEAHWRTALAISPYEQTYLKLVDYLYEFHPERVNEIQGILEDAIANLGQSANLLVKLGGWYEQDGQYDRALSHYKVAKQLEPDNESIDKLIEDLREKMNE